MHDNNDQSLELLFPHKVAHMHAKTYWCLILAFSVRLLTQIAFWLRPQIVADWKLDNITLILPCVVIRPRPPSLPFQLPKSTPAARNNSTTLNAKQSDRTSAAGSRTSATAISDAFSIHHTGYMIFLMLVWNESEDKTFLDACIHELTTNGREGSGLKASSWKTIREKLINEHGKEVDQKQMRNHFDYYKSKYVAWVKLKNKTGSTSTGFQSWGPSSTLPRPVEEFSPHDFDDDVPMETSTQHIGASEESSGRSKNKEVGGNKRVAGKKRDARALEVEEEIVKLARSLVEKMKELKKVKWIRMLMRVWRN
ncbi:unnamed protein product [Lactuca saligna]|uniref:Myb/SANT-like domain-containing protein n=1 Tax=Lactuca saligna TaxID=75948 RepID=A0AA35YSC0_LACSI|nr:unnamed protein product [Lactuca saligna]